MGLNFYHGETGSTAYWSYHGFMLFRSRLASIIGIRDIMQMDGYGGDRVWPDDDIVILLHHSDCDGELSPEECAKVAKRLRELIHFWSDHDYDKQNALMLADTMDGAASSNEPLIFT